jgi:N-carbamoylputrescine amidase
MNESQIYETQQLKIALIQATMKPNLEENLDHFTNLIKKAADQEAKIICLPELFGYPYFAQIEDESNFNFADIIPGRITHFLQEQAALYQITLIGGSVFEKLRENGKTKYYNTSLIFDPTGKKIATYRKMHIPQDPSYYERFYFTPGNLGYVNVEIAGVNIAPLICYDQWFPEPARILALRGVQIIFYPTAIGWTPSLKKEEPFSAHRWEHVMCAHASMNGIFTVACNRVGQARKINFWGGSFVADPYGQVIARASSTNEEVLIVEIDTLKVHDSQEGWGFLKYRRPDTYQRLIEKQNDQT